MSDRESSPDSILRQAELGSGVRRLAGLASVAAPVGVGTARPTLDSLRAQFAEELALLRDEARQQGLALARQDAEAALSKMRATLETTWQKQEQERQKAVDQALQQVRQLVDAVQASHAQMVLEMEPVMARLVLLVVAKLLGQHHADRSVVADLAAQALESYRLEMPLHICVGAADYACIQALMPASELLPLLQLDHQLAPGSCQIDYGSGQLDVGLETQWLALKALMSQPSAGHVADA